jgi:hypothetical protein
MRTVAIIALLIVLMVAGGWLAFSYSGGSAKVELRTDAVKRDLDNVIQGTEKFIKEIGDEKEHSTSSSNVIENSTRGEQ